MSQRIRKNKQNIVKEKEITLPSVVVYLKAALKPRPRWLQLLLVLPQPQP